MDIRIGLEHGGEIGRERGPVLLSENFSKVYLGEDRRDPGDGPSHVYLFDPCEGEPSHILLQSFA